MQMQKTWEKALAAGVLAAVGGLTAYWIYRQTAKGSKKRIKKYAGRLMREMEAAAASVCARMK